MKEVRSFNKKEMHDQDQAVIKERGNKQTMIEGLTFARQEVQMKRAQVIKED